MPSKPAALLGAAGPTRQASGSRKASNSSTMMMREGGSLIVGA
jgi:hypothetical protein